ncbi:fibronectin type III domain-containing protein [Streptomyces sp. NPDC047718]|uniref:fibronectin type III domain-containing protein n=1 Tax=Streptomyces sp. NPDC047718 TaxID=3155479 RepID=UPI0033F6072A
MMATAVLIAPVPLLGMMEPAEAFTTHVVVVGGSLRVDYDPGFSNRQSQAYTRAFHKVFRIRHHADPEPYVVSACAGDQTLAELTIAPEMNDEEVDVTMRMQLFRSGSCDRTNRIAGVSVGPAAISKDETHRFTIPVGGRNSFDRAVARFSVTHVVTPPLAPSDVTATRQSADRMTGLRHILVEWQDSSADETGYEIRNTGNQNRRRVGPNHTSYQWADLNPGEPQCFQVRALGTQASSAWAPAGAACTR